MLRPPFYGMLLFQMAVRGGTRLLSRSTISLSTPDAYKSLKVWSLQDIKTKEIRWADNPIGIISHTCVHPSLMYGSLELGATSIDTTMLLSLPASHYCAAMMAVNTAVTPGLYLHSMFFVHLLLADGL